MRPALRVLLAAALLLGLPLAIGQGAVTFALTLSPASGEVAEGAATSTELVVQNRGVTSLTLTLAADNSSLGVRLAQTNVTIPAASTARILADVTTQGVAPGNYSITFRARDAASSTGPVPAEDSAVFTLRVLPPSAGSPPNGTGIEPRAEGDPPPPANGTQLDGEPTPEPAADAPPSERPPVFLPGARDVRGPRGASTPFSLEVYNPNAFVLALDVTLRLPPGWAGTLVRDRIEVAGNGRAFVNGTVRSLGDQPDAEARVTAHGPTGDAVATLRLGVITVAMQEAGPAGEPTQGAQEGDAGSAAGTPSTQETGPETDGEPAAPPPEDDMPPAPGVLLLRIEPDLLHVPRGGAALAHLVIENGRDVPLDALPLLLASQGFELGPGLASAFAAPGETVRVPIVLRAGDDLPPGTEGAGTVALQDVDAQPAAFRLLVVARDLAADAPAPAETAAAPTPWAVALLAAGAGAAALCIAHARRRRWHLGLVALYARIRPGRVLEHPTRKDLARLVAEEPGIRLTDAQRRLGIANGQVRHHVDRLESAGVVRSVHAGPHRLLYPSAMGRVAPAPGLAERIVETVQAGGPQPAAALAACLGVSRQALHYHLRKLEQEGRLVASRQGQSLVVAAPAARASEDGTSTLKPGARGADAWTRSSP